MPIFNKRRFTFKRRRHTVNEAVEETYQANEEESQTSPKIFTAEEILPKPLLEGEMPTYFHVGGLAKECLTLGYKIGVWRVDCATTTRENITFYSYGQARPTASDITGGVAVREEFKNGKINMTQVWQIDGLMATLGTKTKLGEGTFKALLRGTYAPQGEAGVKFEIHSGYDRNPVRCEVIVPIWKAPKFMGYLMLKPIENFILGYRTVFDINESHFDKHALCLGYGGDRTELSVKLENFETLRGSIFQRLGENWGIALKGHLTGDEAGRFAVGGQYQFNDNTLLKAKVHDDGFLGLVCQVKLAKGFETMYHVGLDMRSPIQGEHKIGVYWSIND